MKIEHIAMYVNDLELAGDFFVNYRLVFRKKASSVIKDGNSGVSGKEAA